MLSLSLSLSLALALALLLICSVSLHIGLMIKLLLATYARPQGPERASDLFIIQLAMELEVNLWDCIGHDYRTL